MGLSQQARDERKGARELSEFHPDKFPEFAFVENIERISTELGLTWMELSERSGVHFSTISNIVRLKRRPGIAIAWSLAGALGVTIDELCNGQEPEEGKDDEND